MSEPKQVIVMRRDLGMRKGKMIAQGAHASMLWLRARLDIGLPGANNHPLHERPMAGWCNEVERDWLLNLYTKICVQVDGLHELEEVVRKAKEAGIEAHIVVDAGLTEFHGVPTATCAAIGPDTADRIDAVTGHLKLY